MAIQEILQELIPINTKDKVDSLIRMITKNHLILNDNIELSIRLAIQKLSIQKYFIEKYGELINDKDIVQEQRRLKKAGQEERNALEKPKAVINPKRKKKKEKAIPEKETKTKYVGSVLRTMKIFGSEFKKKRKRKHIPSSKQGKKSCAISTTNSIRPIYIASGGMNKRY